jgi:solute carrier family 35 protein
MGSDNTPGNTPTARDSEDTPVATKALVTGGYMACSALMLMVNKLSIHYLPAPGVVLLIQFITSAIFAKIIGVTGIDEVDALTLDKTKRFVPAVCAQLMTIFSGMKALQYSNVETFIVFRASVPLFLCLIDYKFLGRELPGTRSALCLSGLLFGTLLYTMTDSAFQIHGYKWIGVWYAAFAFDQAYLKHVVETVKMTPFGGVYYQNTLGSVGLFFIALVSGEFSGDNPKFHPATWSSQAPPPPCSNTPTWTRGVVQGAPGLSLPARRCGSLWA